MTKKILIDFEKSLDPYSGLGQFSLFLKKYFDQSKLEIEYFIPTYKKLVRSFNFLIPKSKVFHAIHQDCPYIPFNKETKYILTIHDLNALYEAKNEKVKNKFIKSLKKKIKRADHITFISNFTKSEVERNFDIKNKNFSVIYNGISLPEKSMKPDFEIDTNFLFTIGTVVPKKNFHVLIDMMKYLPHLKLYIAGTTNNKYARDLKQKIKELNLESHVFFIGTISNEEKKWMYENSKGFVFPSLLEGFGLPVAEAMSLGRPLFISNKTSLPEIGGENAFYFEHFDPQSMANIVNTGLKNFNDDLKNKLILESKKFSWEKAANEYLKIYQELQK